MKAQRRYYIHTQLKGKVKIQARKKTGFATEKKLEELSDRDRKYVKELVSVFGYNIQYEFTA